MAGLSRAAGQGQVECTVHFRTIDAKLQIGAVSSAFSELQYPCILGANRSRSGEDRFSYWAAEPVELLQIQPDRPDTLELLRCALARYRLAEDRPDLPSGMFLGGWAGWFSYDLCRSIERLHRPRIDDLSMPAIALGFYDRLVAYDHKADQFWLIALGLPDDRDTVGKLDGLESALARSARIDHVMVYNIRQTMDLPESNMTKSEYIEAVCHIKRHILDGDVYQVNYSQRFAVPLRARPIEVFNRQGQFNPNPFSAYIHWPPFHVVCASPELFLRIQDGNIETRPIKGTRPRFGRNGPDRVSLKELATSQKEQAELAMIVDLERNDLARICIPGTRHVPVLRAIEAYPTVFHALAVVRGRLLPGIDMVDVVKATFPGGSVTGAPKISAMQIISELEPTARGLYTGSIGYIGIDGSACLNIVIRTAIILEDMAFVQVGGGIVADSNPLQEYDETIAKARALLAGLKGD